MINNPSTMRLTMSFKVWMMEIRAQYLLLPVILSVVGGLLALDNGAFDPVNFMLYTAVMVLLHITVNTLNDYYDHKTGIDLHTHRTMFNGGTGVIQAGFLTPRQVLNAAILSYLAALGLSIYLVIKVGPALLPLVALGMIFALFYTQVFARNMAGEVAAGLGLGFLPVLGAYMIHQPEVNPGCLILAVAAGILTFNLLLLNEFPDIEADRAGGRMNLVIKLGSKRAAMLYTILTASVYGILVLFVVLGTIPTLSLLGLITIPFAYKAAAISFTDPKEIDRFIHGMTANVKVVLMTQVLVAVGILASILIRG